jgi:hypothetical protein
MPPGQDGGLLFSSFPGKPFAEPYLFTVIAHSAHVGWAFGHFQINAWVGYVGHAIPGKSPSRRRRGRSIQKQLQSMALTAGASTKEAKPMPNTVATNLHGHGARSHEPGFKMYLNVALIPRIAALVVVTRSDGQGQPATLSRDMDMPLGISASAEIGGAAWPRARSWQTKK